MKRSFNVKKRIGRKNLILCVVALVLVMLTTVGATYSWIEEVSKVEFNSDTGQETPYKIRGKVLKDTANIVQNDVDGGIKLEDYFNEGGEMHLSPCYSDGETFYFPKEKTTSTTSGADAFRLGTKDDANVNYLQATFRVSSPTANTSYWLQRYDSATRYFNLQDGTGTNDSKDVNPFHDINSSGTDSYMRMSVTVDGATSVYAYNANGKYKKINNGAVTTEQGRCVETYAYYDIENADKTYNNTDTQTTGAGLNQNKTNDNLYCNTLFTVPKGQTKVVTIKIWFEYNNGNVKSYDLSNINFQLTSSWAKTRRIYVVDRTVDVASHNNGTQWLYKNNGKLYWALKDNVGTRWEVPASSKDTVNISGTSYNRYYIDIPAVYNNSSVVLFRCNNAWSAGNTSSTYKTINSSGNSVNTTVNYWDKWETAFPDTFHNETFSIYTDKFGTWESVARHVEIINSCHFTYNGVTQFAQPFAYMWDSSTDTGDDDRVVQNSSWPGVTMDKLNKTKSDLDVYAFYYNSIYDRIIFNDNYNPKSAAYQTQDINLDQAKSNPQYYDGKVYDMATLKWYNNFNALPTYSDYCVYGDFFVSNDEDRYTHTRMVVNPNNSQEVYCRVYVRYQNSANEYYKFKIKKNDASEWWGYGHYNTANEYWYIDGQMSGSDQPTLTNDSSNDLRLHATNTASYTDSHNNQHPGIYGIYYNTSTHKLWVQKEEP